MQFIQKFKDFSVMIHIQKVKCAQLSHRSEFICVHC